MPSSYASSEVSDSSYTNVEISLASDVGGRGSTIDDAQVHIQTKKHPYYPFERYTYNSRLDGPHSDWLKIRCEEHAAIRIYEIEEYLLRRQTVHYSYGGFKETVFGAVAALVPGLYKFATEGLGLRNAHRIRSKFVNAAIELISERKVVTFGRADVKIMFSRPIAYYGDIDGGDLKRGQRFVKAQQPTKRPREDEADVRDAKASVKRARNGTASNSVTHLNGATNPSTPGKGSNTESEPIVMEDIEEGEMLNFQETAAVPVQLTEKYKREREDGPAVDRRPHKRARLC